MQNQNTSAPEVIKFDEALYMQDLAAFATSGYKAQLISVAIKPDKVMQALTGFFYVYIF